MAEKSVDGSKIMLRMSDFTAEPKRILPPIKGYENQPLVTLEQAVQPLLALVPEIEQMVWTVKQNCEKPQDHLTPDESASIMLYTLEWEPVESSFYFILNTTLRSQNRQELKPWFLYLRLVIYALAKLPSLPSRTMYRGVQIDMSKEFMKEKTFVWWSFSSCTSTIDIIKHFLGAKGPRTIVNIECDSAKDISRHSFYQIENEILLYPARQFKVISSLDAGNQLHIIQLKEIQPPFPLIHIPQIIATVSPTIPITLVKNLHQNQKLIELIDKCKDYSEVDLGRQKLIDQDMEIVAKEAIINKQCKTLHLNSNKITSTGVSIIAKTLDGNTTLEWLNFSYNPVGDAGVHFLTKALSLNHSSLNMLHLASSGITDEGAGYLAEILTTYSKLHYLFLPGNQIGDRGVASLTNTLIRHNNTFKLLDLSRNKLVTDASVDYLVEILQRNSSLSTLTITNCNLSEKGKERLRQIAKTKKSFDLEV